MGMVAMVHATRGALNAVEEGLSVALPDAEVIHLMDEGLLRDLLQNFTLLLLEQVVPRRLTSMGWQLPERQ